MMVAFEGVAARVEAAFMAVGLVDVSLAETLRAPLRVGLFVGAEVIIRRATM
jgi:hypothetical protein